MGKKKAAIAEPSVAVAAIKVITKPQPLPIEPPRIRSAAELIDHFAQTCPRQLDAWIKLSLENLPGLWLLEKQRVRGGSTPYLAEVYRTVSMYAHPQIQRDNGLNGADLSAIMSLFAKYRSPWDNPADYGITPDNVRRLHVEHSSLAPLMLHFPLSDKERTSFLNSRIEHPLISGNTITHVLTTLYTERLQELASGKYKKRVILPTETPFEQVAKVA